MDSMCFMKPRAGLISDEARLPSAASVFPDRKNIRRAPTCIVMVWSGHSPITEVSTPYANYCGTSLTQAKGLIFSP